MRCWQRHWFGSHWTSTAVWHLPETTIRMIKRSWRSVKRREWVSSECLWDGHCGMSRWPKRDSGVEMREVQDGRTTGQSVHHTDIPTNTGCTPTDGAHSCQSGGVHHVAFGVGSEERVGIRGDEVRS